MTIYVGIGSLIDLELEQTIKDAITNADSPEDIFVGVALNCREEALSPEFLAWAEGVIETFISNPRVTFRIFSGKENDGLANARINAASMYSGQDYFLQVDAHTMFLQGWDTQLIDLHKKAVLETKTEKTILTAYLGQYSRDVDSGERVIMTTAPSYPVQHPYTRTLIGLDSAGKPVSINIGVPTLQADPINTFPESLQTNKEILPSIKSNGQFIFGNHTYPKNIGLPRYVLFWEEDPIQSINLFDAEFAFAFPNVDLKVLHYYTNHLVENEDGSKRQLPVSPEASTLITMRNNYLQFMYDPTNALKKMLWEEWSHIKSEGAQTLEYYVPLTFR